MAGTGEQPHVERDYLQDLSVRFSVGFELLEKEHVEQPAAVSVRSASGQEVATCALTVKKLDMKEQENAKTHHTERYQQVQRTNPTPVLRRGQPFQCTVRFDRAPDIPGDIIRLVFDIGSGPSVSKGTRTVLEVDENCISEPVVGEWSITLLKRQGTTITLQVLIPASAPVGAWRCWIQTARESERHEFRCENFVFILFNPWNPDDGVYLEDEDLLSEYIMNDYGKLWMGSACSPTGRPWLFGQFSDVVLPVCALLMERSDLAHSQRWDPVQYARAVSAVVNSDDDKGLIVAAWKENYEDGTAPLTWTGTVGIMEQFMNNGHKSVCYGQCWVFSAATVTVCRALGIPCRSITNFNSAHDTDGSMTTDVYYDSRGDKVCVRGTNDRMWTYHVWNEVWMRRPDLGPEYDGWQVVDATPMEPSLGLFRCGPTSVKAVRCGEVGLPYDGPFVYAEVNADTYYFTQDDSCGSGFVLTSVETSSAGLRQITKMVGTYDGSGNADLEDVTVCYKAPEGSPEERAVNKRALSTIRGGRKMLKDNPAFEKSAKAPEEVTFEMVDVNNVLIGHSLNVVVKFVSTSEEPRTVTCILKADSMYYNGTDGHKIRHAKEEYCLSPDECTQSIEVQLCPEEYLDKLVDQSYIKIVAIGEVKETGQKWIKEKTIELQTPIMTVEAKESVNQVGQMVNIDFSFKNPLNVALSSCSVMIECPEIQPRRVFERPDVPAGEVLFFTLPFQLSTPGERLLVATFTSEQLSGIVGSCTLNVPC